jgi:sensor domain CHASE-containing protein
MEGLAAALLQYYFPAIIFLIVTIMIFFKLRTISRKISRSIETNREMADTLIRIQNSLESGNA